MILSDMESLRRILDFLLLMHTEGRGKLNISRALWSNYYFGLGGELVLGVTVRFTGLG